MKIEHLSATVSEILGHFQDGVKFPDGTEGRIEFSFTYAVPVSPVTLFL